MCIVNNWKNPKTELSLIIIQTFFKFRAIYNVGRCNRAFGGGGAACLGEEGCTAERWAGLLCDISSAALCIAYKLV